MIKLNLLKDLLTENGYTCVLSDGKEVVYSFERGVKPLIGFIESGKNFKGFCAADKVVGKAAALLYAHMGVAALYASVISDGALTVCGQYGIAVEYGVKTEKIINRRGDGICPMEQTVAEISDPKTAFVAIKEKLKSLS